MQYVIPVDTKVHVQRIANPWVKWKPFRTTKLQRFDSCHEVHDRHYVFTRDDWKLAVLQRHVWHARVELREGRSGRHVFLVRDQSNTDVIHITDECGKWMQTLRFSDNDYKAYLDLLQRGGGKDPYDYRT